MDLLTGDLVSEFIEFAVGHNYAVFLNIFRSNSTLRLDWKINISRLWLSSRKADATEVAETDPMGDGSRSFVIGWPPMNAVLTFATSNEKTLWTAKLEEYELRKAFKNFVVQNFSICLFTVY